MINILMNQKSEAFHNVSPGGHLNIRGNVRTTSEAELASYRHEEILGRLAKMENGNPQGQNLLKQGTGNIKENRTCYYCNTKGHIQRNCIQFADDVKTGIIPKNDWRVKNKNLNRDPLRAVNTFMRKGMGHTAVSTIQVSSVTL